MTRLILFLTSVLFFAGCKGQPDGYISDLPPKDFSKVVTATPDPQLIDVRTPAEFSSQHIPGAVNIDWNGNDFEDKASKLDRSKPVFVYCKVGGRSRQAADKLLQMGFTQIYDLQGGIMKWNAEGYSEPEATGGLTVSDYNKMTGSDKKVLVSFHAVWCGPCKKMKPYVLKMQEEMKNSVTIIRLDADENTELVSELKIDGIPALFLYKKGKLVWEYKGFISEEDLKKQLQ